MSTKLGFGIPTKQGFRFSAPLQEMAESEILAMVPADRLKAMRDREPHPLIKAFVVGHEGESEGHLIGIGNVVKRWLRGMIQTLGQKVRAGLQLFHSHATGTNAHEGREAIGEVVGSMVKPIDGRESVIVACHIYPQFKHLPLDVASVEADATFVRNGAGTVDIVDIGEVTGIALGNSTVNRPGFPGATLLGQLQAFAVSQDITPGSRLRLGYSTHKGEPGRVRLAD
jgi:hypothetical protein